ncbi:hypothetical protein ABTZ78_00735 [Streptomyces bauhiniae]|uniref:hypothetical protein n=1 Tax=Streptomyces bauhiniae TaxID=2340725 RepID=UPI003332B93C
MTKRLISLYAALLVTLSILTAAPTDAIAHPAMTTWTLAAMPSSVLMTVTWMATSTLFPPNAEPGPALSTLLTLGFTLTASAMNIGALLILRKACSRCRVLARA